MLMSLAKRTLPSESIHALKRLRDSDRGLRAARQLQRLREAVQLRWLGLVRLSPRLSSAHYGLLSGAFGREHQGVVDGRWRYLKEKDESRATQFLLRRNVHRLEKGLLMRPRKPVFALEFIEETVEVYRLSVAAFASGAAPADADAGEILWARDVLARYFDAVAPHPTIDRARRVVEAVAFPEALAYESERGCQLLAPYARDLAQASSVSYEALYELAKRRRSVRWYKPDPVPREMIDRAIRVAAQAPSACNRQPFQFRIFDQPGIVQEIVALPTGTPGYRENIPVVVVVVGQLSAYFDERDRHGIYIDGSLAAMSFILALESQGLSSCCINWPEIDSLEQRMAELLGLEPQERVIMLIAVGHPDPEGLVAYSHKKSLSQLRSYNRL